MYVNSRWFLEVPGAEDTANYAWQRPKLIPEPVACIILIQNKNGSLDNIMACSFIINT